MLEAGGVVELLAGVAEDEVDGCVGFGNQFAKAVEVRWLVTVVAEVDSL